MSDILFELFATLGLLFIFYLLAKQTDRAIQRGMGHNLKPWEDHK